MIYGQMLVTICIYMYFFMRENHVANIKPLLYLLYLINNEEMTLGDLIFFVEFKMVDTFAWPNTKY